MSKLVKAGPFDMAGRTVKTWIRIAINKPEALKAVLPFVKKSYEVASQSNK